MRARGNTLRQGSRYVLVANRCKQAELGDAPEHVRGNIRATGVVAEILLEFLFMAIRSSEARLNGDPGHAKYPLRNAYTMISIKGGPAQVASGQLVKAPKSVL